MDYRSMSSQVNTGEKIEAPIYLSSVASKDIEKPFEGDLFERKALADRLTGMISRFPEGGVIAIDAKWGEGKTWFGRHWQAKLTADGFRSAYIDSFLHDHVEDPFVMVSGEFLELIKADKSASQRILERGKDLVVALAPSAAKAAVNIVGKWAFGAGDLSKGMKEVAAKFQEGVSGGLEKIVSKQLEGYSENKKTVEAFRAALAEVAAEGDKLKPIVIFLDELDRCRPDFAVRAVERIKHFFDVPGIVFVLLMNREQLCQSVKGIYGSGVDASAYLGKFIHLSLTLPKTRSPVNPMLTDNRKFCYNMLLRYGFAKDRHVDDFSTAFGTYADMLGLSLRDVERAVALYSLAQPIGNASVALAWPIAMKLAFPELFQRVIANDRSGHLEAEKLARDLRERARSLSDSLTLFQDLHDCKARAVNTHSQDSTNTVLMWIPGMNADQFLRWIFERIDLAVLI